MFDEEDRPRAREAAPKPRILDGLSLEDLTAYREFLRSEERRVEDAIRRKGSMSEAAEALFRK